jgi:hypothetical protein
LDYRDPLYAKLAKEAFDVWSDDPRFRVEYSTMVQMPSSQARRTGVRTSKDAQMPLTV